MSFIDMEMRTVNIQKVSACVLICCLFFFDNNLFAPFVGRNDFFYHVSAGRPDAIQP